MSEGFQQVIIIGNVTKDPRRLQTNDGNTGLSFGVAVNESWYDRANDERKETVSFYNVALWGNQANGPIKLTEMGALKKGSLVQVIGKPYARAYTTNDGEVRASQEIRPFKFQLLSSSSGGNSGGASGSSGSDHEPAGPDVGDGDDIPF